MGSSRPISDVGNTGVKSLLGFPQRPISDVPHYKSPEAEAIDQFFVSLSYYERTLEQMARAKLDDNFREELKAIEQWFSVLSEPERTTALYSLLQHTTQVQIRFLITVLQQMAQKDPIAGVTSPVPSGTAPGGIVGGQHTKTVSGASATSQGLAAGSRSSQPGAIGSPVVSSTSVLATTPGPAPDVDHLPEDEKYLPMAGPTSRSGRRLYDRHSAPVADEKFAQYLGTGPVGDSTHRPVTPVDEAIASANWSVVGGNVVEGLGLSGTGSSLAAAGVGGYGPAQSENDGALHLKSEPIGPAGGGSGSYMASRPLSPATRAPQGHPSDGWGHINLGSHGTPGNPGSPHYAMSDYSDSYDEFGADNSDQHIEIRLKGPSHKEKGKIPEAVDLETLGDIPSWLRSLRLHKYTPMFEGCEWKDIVNLDDDGLQARGVSALGARRKLLKVFELIRHELQQKAAK